MSTRTYSCTMPERHAKDRKHRLLLTAFLFALAAALCALSLPTVQGTALYLLSLLGCLLFGAAAGVSFWIWFDVR